MNASRIPALVSRLVTVHGWHSDPVIPKVATRMYDTAVGPKQASVWFSQCGETGTIYFWPEYQSEGRNAVANCSAWVRADLSDEQANEVVDNFAEALTACVSQTYAARLLELGVTA